MTYYLLEISCQYAPVALRAQFTSRRRAENARRKLAKEMAKGKFRNDDGIVEIKGDTSTLSVRASDVAMTHVVDLSGWTELDNAAKDALGATADEGAQS